MDVLGRRRDLGRLALCVGLWCFAWAAHAEIPTWIRQGSNGFPGWTSQLQGPGYAEVDTYDSTTTLHGQARAYTMVVLFSLANLDVPGGGEIREQGLIPAGHRKALKMSIISEQIQTDQYPYDLASTVYADPRNPLDVFSSLTTSHDWNGIIARRFRGGAKPLLEVWSSSHPADTRRELPPGVAPLEAVPLILRSMDWSTTASFQCLPTLMAHRVPWSGAVPEPGLLTLSAAVDGTETTTTAAGTFECYRVKVFTPDGRVPMMLWYEKARPHRLVYKTTISGKIFALRSSEIRLIPPSDPR